MEVLFLLDSIVMFCIGALILIKLNKHIKEIEEIQKHQEKTKLEKLKAREETKKAQRLANSSASVTYSSENKES